MSKLFCRQGLAALFLLCQSMAPLRGQCLQVLNCPVGTPQICDESNNDPLFWNEQPYTYSTDLGLNDLHEAAADLFVRVIPCPGEGAVTAHYALWFDLDNDNLAETVLQSQQLPPPGKVLANNAFNPGYTGGDTVVFDKRPVPDSLLFRFVLEEYVSGDTLGFRLRWTTTSGSNANILPRLPEGKHRIVWKIKQGSLEQTCEYSWRVKDCLPPLLICKPQVEVVVPVAGVVQLTAEMIADSIMDNITPAGVLETSLRVKGTGTGYPLDSVDLPVQSLSFFCADLGVDTVELWARDHLSNAAFCKTTVSVIAGNYACKETPVVCSKIWSDTARGLEEVKYYMEWIDDQDATQKYDLPLEGECGLLDTLPPAGEFVLKAQKNDNPLNGVSTLDIVLITQHVLGISPFTKPWQYFAADVNRNGGVSTFDGVELRRLILGMIDKFQNNDSWQFFQGDCPDSIPPAGPSCPRFYSYETANAGLIPSEITFLAVKTGDVNGTAVANSTQEPEGRSDERLMFPDIEMKAGESRIISLRLEKSASMSGFQASFRFDPSKADIRLDGSETLPGFSSDHYFSDPNGQCRISWSQATPLDVPAGAEILRFRVHALQDIRTGRMIEADAQGLSTEYYDPQANPVNLRLETVAPMIETAGVLRFSGNDGLVRVHTQKAGPVKVFLFDLQGRLLQSAGFEAEKDLNLFQFRMDRPLSSGNLYFWQMETPDGYLGGKAFRH